MTVKQAKNNIKKELNALIKLRKDLWETISLCDEETQDLLHILENGGINAVEITKVTQKLTSVRRQRRKAKLQIAEIDRIVDRINSFIDIPSKSNKANTYCFKTDIASETLNRYKNYSKGKEYKFKE